MAAEQLLNFSIPLDVNVLEQVVQSVYQGSPQQVRPIHRAAHRQAACHVFPSLRQRSFECW